MSSSDYTALKKYKEIQGACKVDDIGNPVSPSWFNIPIGTTADCTFTLGTGPTGMTGSTGYTGRTGPTGLQGPAGSSNGGAFVIYCESNTGFNTVDASGFCFSFG